MSVSTSTAAGASSYKQLGNNGANGYPSQMTSRSDAHARVSTDDQTLHLERGALQYAGCEVIYEEAAEAL